MYKMNDREERLYWTGTHFPGTLSNEELEEWARLKIRVEGLSVINPEEQERYGYYLIIFTIFLCIMAFVL